MINWTTARHPDLHEYETSLRLAQKLRLPPHTSFLGEVRRVQSRFHIILNPVIDSLTEILDRTYKESLLRELIRIISLSQPAVTYDHSLHTSVTHSHSNNHNSHSLLSQKHSTSTISPSLPIDTSTTATTTAIKTGSKYIDRYIKSSSELLKVVELAQIASRSHNSLIQQEYSESGTVLLGQYYIHPTNHVISHDINLALIHNLNNPFISEIILLNEIEIDFNNISIPTMTTTTTSSSHSSKQAVVFPNLWKIKQVVLGRRVLFRDLFSYANKHLVGRIVVVGMYVSTITVQIDYSLLLLFIL